MDKPINFLENRFNYLSPFSAHQISIWGEKFATVEHAYQCARIKPGAERDSIKNATSPLEAWAIAQRHKVDLNLLIENFDKEAVMEELFRAKINQHPDILKVLTETRDRELLKVSETDSYWGTGKDGSGQNKMGKIWMKLRSEFIKLTT